MTTKHEVIALFKKHPDATSGDLARELKCEPSYVRATLKRAGLKLSRKSGKRGGLLELKRQQKALAARIAADRKKLEQVRAALSSHSMRRAA